MGTLYVMGGIVRGPRDGLVTWEGEQGEDGTDSYLSYWWVNRSSDGWFARIADGGFRRDVLIQPVNAVIAVGNGVLQPGQGVFTTSDGEQVQYIRKLSVKATAYSRFDKGCNDWTATGAYATYGVIAVDPTVIPLGSKVYIVSDDGKFIYGFASAEDTGGAIKGNKIDLCYDSVAECFIFGRRQCTVYILSYGD
jgi:3D (Asp-Asp-Asp) domain-containing protein